MSSAGNKARAGRGEDSRGEACWIRLEPHLEKATRVFRAAAEAEVEALEQKGPPAPGGVKVLSGE